eukprot:15465483-Alexandrium_andersonii.AAC.1
MRREARCHRNAIAKINGATQEEFERQKAPTHLQFSLVLDAVRRNTGTGDSGVPGAGKRKKVRKIKWALAEAVRARNRAVMLAARSMSLHQDARKGLLAVRFQSCDDKLVPSFGLMGAVHLRSFGSDAMAIQSATTAILRSACTPDHNPPYRTALPSSVPDRRVIANVVEATELLDADAAADEQLAMKFVAGDRPNPVAMNIFSNILVRNKDKPHASRRTAAPCALVRVSAEACSKPDA